MTSQPIEAPARIEHPAAGAGAIETFTQLQNELLDYYDVAATSRFVELAKPRMRAHVLEAGSGSPVVVFHGGDGEAVNWAPLMTHLQGSAKIYAVDRPGCGLSDAFDYRDVDLRTHAADFVGSLLDAFGLEKATLVGGSMGGFFALAGTLAHPDRVEGLALVGFPAGTISEIPDNLLPIIENPSLAVEFMRSRDSMEAQKAQYLEMFHTDPSIVPDLYFETRIAGLRLPSEQGTWATILPRLGEPAVYLGDDLPQITAPTVVLWGDHDMASPEVGREINARIPNAQFEYLPGTGHFPFVEVPERTTQIIVDLLERVRAGEGA